MDIDKEIADLAAGVKKAPRKPRPSEIAAKLAKLAKKAASEVKPKPEAKKKKAAKKPAKRTAAKGKKPAKKTAKRKPVKKAKGAKKTAKRTAGVIARPERMDMRLTKAEKALIKAVAKRTKRTITSVVYEAIAKLK